MDQTGPALKFLLPHMPAALSFASRLVRWQAAHGRHDLPWQRDRDPYRVWLSEVMLQQTQVQTVIAYFERFVQRFPNIASLADAPQDEVMGLWSGLGYYSRARHLHACAQVIVRECGGMFPARSEALRRLPGIGPSTAAAIASICFSERVAILDGNVKRVLTRYLGFAEDLSEGQSLRALWAEAQRLLPRSARNMPAYTQAIMDLGATLCVQRSPQCGHCPLSTSCQARRSGEPERFPIKTRKLKRSTQSLWLVWAQRGDGASWLHKRDSSGIWASMYCLPSFESEHAALEALETLGAKNIFWLQAFTHVLTHKDLRLHPVRARVPDGATPGLRGRWVLPREWGQMGLPAPIKALLQMD